MAENIVEVTSRSSRAHRVSQPFGNRSGFVRLDRNEDPVGWPTDLILEFTKTITPDVLAAYPDPSILTREIAHWLDRDSSEILVSAGSSEGLRLIIETFLDEQRSFVRLDPSYSLYELYGNVAGSRVLVTPNVQSEAKRLDDLQDAISQSCPSLVMIANPDQPLGLAFSVEALERIARTSLAVGAVLVIDEAYYLFGSDTALPLLDEFPNLIIVRTFSKAFGLAGIRLGYMIAQREMIQNLQRLEPAVPPSSISLLAGTWALKHLDVVLSRANEVIRGREFLMSRLSESKVTAHRSSGNFVLISTDSDTHAQFIVNGSRERGFLIKGPLTVSGVGPCVRVTVGPVALVEHYWAVCGDLYRTDPDVLIHKRGELLWHES